MRLMIKPIKALVLSSLAMLVSINACAEDTLEYASVGSWTIGVDPTLGYGCFVFAGWEGDSVLRLGFDPDSEKFYILFGDGGWKSLELAKDYEIAFSFGDESPWEGKAVGFSFDPPEDQPYLRMAIADDSVGVFVGEFMNERNLVVEYNDREILKLNLKDNRRAGQKLLECQRDMNKLHPQDDPFRATPTSREKGDPFAGA
jgi:hypothetical protein